MDWPIILGHRTRLIWCPIKELINAQQAARLANELLTSTESVSYINDENFDFLINVSAAIEEIESEIQNSKDAVQSVMFMVDDATKNFTSLCDMLLVFKTSVSEDSAEQSLILNNSQKLNSFLRKKIFELESEKILLDNQLADLQKHLQESKLDAENSQNSLMENLEQQKFENAELISYIQALEKDLSCLTSSTVAKERETIRKDLEKAKTKLKETESKLKIAIQEKTKVEGEKAYAEREIKRLQGQISLLERDNNKRDILAGRRRDSIIEKGSKTYDPKRPKSPAFSLEQTLQEEHKKLEVLAFESETRIASLEEEITTTLKEKEEIISINEGLMLELEGLTEKVNTSTSELYNLTEEISALKQRLEESDVNQENLRSSIKVLSEEKEELAMQLTDSLLQIEEERAIWSAKEKAALLAVEEQAKSNNVQITSLSTKLLELSKAKNQVEELGQKLSSMEVKMHADGVTNNKEMAKLRMRVRGTQAKLDAFRYRYKEAIDESVLINKRYKDQLAAKGEEVLNLMKELAALKGQ